MEAREKNWGQVTYDQPLKKFTSFRIGGACDRLVEPGSVDQLAQVLSDLREAQEDFLVMGNATNMLVSDKGIRGTVIRLGQDFSDIQVKGQRVIAQAGALMQAVANKAQEAGLEGLEFAHGIPGSVGGGVTMNAGAYGGEMVQVVESVTVIDKDGVLRTLTGEEMNFTYRHSAVQDQGLVVVEVTYLLKPGDRQEIRKRMDDYWQRRLDKQPLDMASAGSTFKRPPGYFAGKLIDDSGLRGLAHGGAQVSSKHCGFIVNRGQASCQDVVELIRTVQAVVKAKFGVSLETEVKVRGE